MPGFASKLAIQQCVVEADTVIGAALIPGATAPKLVTKELVLELKPGSVLVDIAIDQGGCFEGRYATTHAPATDRGARLDLLLRGELARRGAQHLASATLQYTVALPTRVSGVPAATTAARLLGLNTPADKLTHSPVRGSWHGRRVERSSGAQDSENDSHHRVATSIVRLMRLILTRNEDSVRRVVRCMRGGATHYHRGA